MSSVIRPSSRTTSNVPAGVTASGTIRGQKQHRGLDRGLRRLPARYSTGMSRAYEEIVEFIAAGTCPSDVVAFQPSEEAKARVAELIAREKSAGLSPDETGELDHCL